MRRLAPPPRTAAAGLSRGRCILRSQSAPPEYRAGRNAKCPNAKLTEARHAVTLRPVEWLQTTLAMYARAVTEGGRRALRNWPMFVALFAYGAVFRLAYAVAVYAGPLGGIVVYLATALCFGSFLASVEAIVRSGRATVADFRGSFGAYFSDVIGVMFAQWAFLMVIGLLAQATNGPAIVVFGYILAWVFFNPVPELIYLGHYSTMELLSESYQFIARNWIEWFPLNIVLGMGLIAVWNLPDGGLVWTLLQLAATGIFVYFTMVVRGLLFMELADSSRRGRIFRHRAGN